MRDSLCRTENLFANLTGSFNGFVPITRENIIWTNGDLVYWRIFASHGLDELMVLPKYR